MNRVLFGGVLVTLGYVYAVDGFVRLQTGISATTVLRDLVLYLVVLGGLAKLAVGIDAIPKVRYGGFVLAFVGLVLVQVFNPDATSLPRAFAAARPHLEFVPLFFLGFALLATADRLLAVAIVLVVAGAANGIVGLVQVNLTPDQLASWGPGYERLVTSGGPGEAARNARTFVTEDGTQRVRPPALGADAGFGGTLAAVVLPLALALALGAGGARARTVALVSLPLLLAALFTSQTRAAVVAGIAAVVAFLLLGAVGREAVRVIAGTLAVGFVAALVAGLAFGRGLDLSRFESIAPGRLLTTFTDERGVGLELLPTAIAEYPFGAGMGSSGPATSLNASVNTGNVSGENLFIYLVTELGLAGLLIIVVLLTVSLREGFKLSRRLREVRSRLLVTAFAAGLVVVVISTLSGAVTAGPPLSPFLWMTLGLLARWKMLHRPEERAPLVGFVT